MAKARRSWLRIFLTGRTDKENKPAPAPATKERKRWSFRRSTAHPSLNAEPSLGGGAHGQVDVDLEHARVDAVVVRLPAEVKRRPSAIKDVAAVKIQAVYRAYLARKALKALKGLVKLQALIRGHLVRKQATATLRCMQALVAAQARACLQRNRMAQEATHNPQRPFPHRRPPSLQESRFRHCPDADGNAEDKVTSSRKRYSTPRMERQDHRISSVYSAATHIPCKAGQDHHCSPVPSALTDMSPRVCSGHLDEIPVRTAQSSPHYFTAISKLSCRTEDSCIVSNDCQIYPNYMANTESSRAKARSQSAPKQRRDAQDRQVVRRKPPIEYGNIPRGVRMQRSSSHAG